MSQGCKPNFSETFERLSGLIGSDRLEPKAKAVSSPQACIGVVNGPVYFLGEVAAKDLPKIIAATREGKEKP